MRAIEREMEFRNFPSPISTIFPTRLAFLHFGSHFLAREKVTFIETIKFMTVMIFVLIKKSGTPLSRDHKFTEKNEINFRHSDQEQKLCVVSTRI